MDTLCCFQKRSAGMGGYLSPMAEPLLFLRDQVLDTKIPSDAVFMNWKPGHGRVVKTNKDDLREAFSRNVCEDYKTKRDIQLVLVPREIKPFEMEVKFHTDKAFCASSHDEPNDDSATVLYHIGAPAWENALFFWVFSVGLYFAHLMTTVLLCYDMIFGSNYITVPAHVRVIFVCTFVLCIILQIIQATWFAVLKDASMQKIWLNEGCREWFFALATHSFLRFLGVPVLIRDAHYKFRSDSVGDDRTELVLNALSWKCYNYEKVAAFHTTIPKIILDELLLTTLKVWIYTTYMKKSLDAVFGASVALSLISLHWSLWRLDKYAKTTKQFHDELADMAACESGDPFDAMGRLKSLLDNPLRWSIIFAYRVWRYLIIGTNVFCSLALCLFLYLRLRAGFGS